MRTHYAGTLRATDIGTTVTLAGFVKKRRDLGDLIFIDLRDKSGIAQVVFSAEHDAKLLEDASQLRNEYVLSVTGKVLERSSKNEAIETGDVEIQATSLTILSKAETTPLIIDDETDASEAVRMVYRYLDLRRPVMRKNLEIRHMITKSMRQFLDGHEFMDVETPYLNKSTPEGARDYLVPSRVHEGAFYALPQSPQIFKQLLMVGGIERYYQIAKCFRDEDLRADRQPEFTQVDIEMSFMTEHEIRAMIESMLKQVVCDVRGIKMDKPFKVMRYDEAMERYGSDKPDTRFAMELTNVTDIFEETTFGVFASAETIRTIVVKNKADEYSRKKIDALTEYVKTYKAKGLAYIKVEATGCTGGISKFISEQEYAALTERLHLEPNDIVFLGADKTSIVYAALGNLRTKLGKEHGYIDETALEFLWVVDWPMFEYDEETDTYTAAHHPFTMPNVEDLEKLETEPHRVYSQSYDIVLNGYEIGGGSLRINQSDIQERVFKALGLSQEEIDEKFGFMVEAFKYGTPPHGGIALGLDRIAMILTGSENIREVIAFPKNAQATCMMTQAPSIVDVEQLDELHISVKSTKEVE